MNGMVVSFPEMLTCEYQLEGSEKVSCTCKGPETGEGLVHYSSSKEAGLVGVEKQA